MQTDEKEDENLDVDCEIERQQYVRVE